MRESVSAVPRIPDPGQRAGRGAAGPVPDRRVGIAPPHIPSLDGLRTASLAIVFVAHAGLEWIIPGGFGVTVFFFLSGFLITTLMRFEQQTTGGVSVRNFYLRRALRILPPFYLVLALACALALLRVLPGDLRLPVVLAQALHVANYWYVWFGAEGSAAGTVPFWSLAVEEHFYLVFPLLYLGLIRLVSNRAQARTFWALCAIVCAWRCILVFVFGVTENRTFMATDTRVDSILFGCALAVAMNPVLDAPSGSERLWKWVLLPAALSLLMFTFVYRAPWFRETLRYTVQGIALIPLFVSAIRFPKWAPFRVLNARPVAYVGVLSYTLYLVHQVALLLVIYQLPDVDPVRRALLALLLSFVVALTIHHLVEKPCARLRKRLTRVAPVARRDRAGSTAVSHALIP
jgi:peptidoglycan/LPS O-acetylase OafA/YrhL